MKTVPVKPHLLKHLLGAFMGIPTLMISLCFAKQLDKQCFPETRRSVRVELALQHNNIDYLCIREQLYSKDNSGSIRRHNQTTFKIAYKNADGQREYVPDGETELRMKEILPKELSKYFSLTASVSAI